METIRLHVSFFSYTDVFLAIQLVNGNEIWERLVLFNVFYFTSIFSFVYIHLTGGIQDYAVRSKRNIWERIQSDLLW